MKPLMPLTIEQAAPEAKELLEGVKKKIGRIPNFYATLANSPIAMKAMFAFLEKLSKTELTPKESEAIALIVGEKNDCDYCVRAHTVIAKMRGATEAEALEFRQGFSSEPKINALVRLAAEAVDRSGAVSDKTIEEFLMAGYSKSALIEVLSYIALNIFTNLVNHLARTEHDFPEVPKLS